MKKFIAVLSLSICFNQIVAQNCPQGYEERVVKCNGDFVKKCIPINFTCNKCWHVEYSDCSGSIDKSIFGNHYNTYDECLKNASELQINFKPSSGCPNKFKTFRITLNGSKDNLCAALDVDNNNNSSQNNSSSNKGANNNDKSNQNKNNTSNKTSNNNQTGINKPFPVGPRDLQLQADFEFFYVQHHNAEEKLEEIKNKYPANAMLYESNYRPKLIQLLNSVKSEDAKNNPSPQNVKAFGKQLDNLIQQMETAETMALKSSNAQKTQQQQYQNQADDHLNKAQDKTQSSISNQLNLDLAKTNAMMAGNTQQLYELQQQQIEQSKENDKKFIQTTTDFANSVSALITKTYSHKEDLKKQYDIELVQDINEAEKRYNSNPNVEDALFLARYTKNSYYNACAFKLGHYPALLRLYAYNPNSDSKNLAIELLRLGLTQGDPAMILDYGYMSLLKLKKIDSAFYFQDIWKYYTRKAFDSTSGVTALKRFKMIDDFDTDSTIKYCQNKYLYAKSYLNETESSWKDYYNNSYFENLENIYFEIAILVQLYGNGTKKENLEEAIRRYDQAINVREKRKYIFSYGKQLNQGISFLEDKKKSVMKVLKKL